MADEQKKPVRDKGNKKGPEVMFLCACLFPREREPQLQKRSAEVHTKGDRGKLNTFMILHANSSASKERICYKQYLV